MCEWWMSDGWCNAADQASYLYPILFIYPRLGNWRLLITDTVRIIAQNKTHNTLHKLEHYLESLQIWHQRWNIWRSDRISSLGLGLFTGDSAWEEYELQKIISNSIAWIINFWPYLFPQNSIVDLHNDCKIVMVGLLAWFNLRMALFACFLLCEKSRLWKNAHAHAKAAPISRNVH